MKRLLPILLLLVLSCDDDEIDPLVATLTGTSWQLETTELLDVNGDIYLTIESPDDLLQGPYAITFYNSETILTYHENNNSSRGCGQWAIENGKLRFALTTGQIIPNLCDLSNFSIHHYSPGADFEVVNDELTLDAWIYNGHPKFLDLEEVQDKLSSGELTVRSYYKRTRRPSFQPDLSCCGRFDWF